MLFVRCVIRSVGGRCRLLDVFKISQGVVLFVRCVIRSVWGQCRLLDVL